MRYWLAKEAVAKGEMLLGSQNSSLGRLSANATSIMGWSVTISLALTAAIASALLPPANAPAHTASLLSHLLWPAAAAESLMLIASICCFVVLWPGKWSVAAFEPDLVLNTPYETELEVLEAMASGYAEGVARNASGLNRLEKLLRVAWLCFMASPVVGLIAYFAI
ncbi:MAG TPA: hypothetical protein VND95_03505 [Stellaceae bacterium]|nr:hypothetical protein [Stellaceae bacterium]